MTPPPQHGQPAVMAIQGAVLELPAQTIAGRYRLLEQLGEGSMGAVYRAEHLYTKRIVALKLLYDAPGGAAVGGDELNKRFLTEAQTPGRINHPGIAEIFDACIEDGCRFIAMELLEGSDLAARLESRTLAPSDGLRIIVKALEPLGAAHASGFVHRDMKPENIFLARRYDGVETVKLVDFGIVRNVLVRGVTKTCVPMGTPVYMSPEQTRNARHAGPASDIWAVGVMLYEVLTGSLPFEGASIANLFYKINLIQPEPARARCPGISQDLEHIVHTCLQKDPKDRYQHAHALRAALLNAGAAR